MLRKIVLDDWFVVVSLVCDDPPRQCPCTPSAVPLITKRAQRGQKRWIHTSIESVKDGDSLANTACSLTRRKVDTCPCIIPCSEATAKFSITIMLMRITTSARWKRFFASLIAATVMITVAKFFGIIFSCWPIERLWDVGSAVGHCDVTERTVIIYIQGGKTVCFIETTFLIVMMVIVMAAAYDVLLATIPVLLLWEVQMSRYGKASLCGLFALGLLWVHLP